MSKPSQEAPTPTEMSGSETMRVVDAPIVHGVHMLALVGSDGERSHQKVDEATWLRARSQETVAVTPHGVVLHED